MRLTDFLFGLIYLFNLVALLNSYPWEAEVFSTTPSRAQDGARSRWVDRQQLLRVIIPTDNYRNERVSSWTKRQSPVSDERPLQSTEWNIYSSHEPTRNWRQQFVTDAPRKNAVTRRKVRTSTSPSRLHARLGTEEVPSVLSDEDEQSRTSTSQTQRRSPAPTLNSNSKSQQVIRHGGMSKESQQKSSEVTTIRADMLTTVSPNVTRAQWSYRPPPTLPRPPTYNSTRPRTSTSTVGTTRAVGEIVFPDGKRPAPSFLPASPCQGSTFCEGFDDDYPMEHIKRLLQAGGKNFTKYFAHDEPEEPDIAHRIDDVPGENPICPSREQIISPSKAKNIYNTTLFIANTDDPKMRQEVVVEICINDRGPCTMGAEFSSGYIFFCKQKYVYRQLYALEENGKEIGPHKFKLPSSCSCYYKQKADFESRLGIGPKISPVKATTRRTKKLDSS